MTNSQITIVMADDHQIFLDGLKLLFENLEGFNLLGSAADGDGVSQLIRQHHPDIALLDLSMPGITVQEIVSQVQTMAKPTTLIALTMLNDTAKVNQLLALGFSGYVSKDTAFEDLLEAIATVMRGEQYVSPSLVQQMASIAQQQEIIRLTKREKEVLVCAARGGGNKQIAEQLSISERTVCFHLSNCFSKLEVANRSHAIAKALDLKLINLLID